MWIYIGLAVGVIAGGYMVITYNSLVGKRNKVNNAWSQVEVQLKRRFDLIPNIVETVKGYAAHEKDTLERVTQIRAKFMNVQNREEAINSNSEMSNILGKLFAVAESYPQLKADSNFIGLQQELARTEDKISFSRQFYNDVVMELNNAIQMFPSNMIAAMFGFKKALFMEVDSEEKKNTVVKFD